MSDAGKRFTLTVVVLGLMGGVAGRADADLTIYADPAYTVVGDSSTSAPGFGTGSWQAAATGSTPDNKSEFYITPSALFGHDVLVGDIASISYWTNKPGNSGSVDWSLTIYTDLTGTNDTGSFYHSRLTSEPYFTQTSAASDPSNTWHKWSTNDPTNPMLFYDQARSGAYGTYLDPTLAGIQSGGGTWSNNGAPINNYSPETVKYFSLQTGMPGRTGSPAWLTD